MALNFILVLLLVVGLILANLALLKYGSKPMPKKKTGQGHSDSNPQQQAQSQAAVSSALYMTQSGNHNAEQSDQPTAQPASGQAANQSDQQL